MMSNNNKPWAILAFLLIVASVTLVRGNADQVTDLPGLANQPSFRHYSGYLNTTSPNRFLHYWFVESARSPHLDPLLLWMNGGPGCSSLDGLLTEQGPFGILRDGKTVYYNNFTWNQVANVIFLEAPAGVGFSYAVDGNVTTDDDQTAADNHAALKHFFVKFPQFKSNDFYITGESYGGIYVPTLTVQVLRHSPDINLKGYAVGNGYLDQQLLGDSLVLFGYFHGLIGQTLWRELLKGCCNSGSESFPEHFLSQPKCSFVTNPAQECKDAVNKAFAVIRGNDIDIYNLYHDCDNPEQLYHGRPHEEQNLISEQLDATRIEQRSGLSRRHVSKKLIAMQLNVHHNRSLIASLGEDPPCIDDSYVAKYLNQPEVRAALHISPEAATWDVCSEAVEEGYSNIYSTMKPQILELVNSGKLRGLIYNGDVDMACNFLGDEWFVDNLGLKLVDDYRKWHYNNQVAGFVKHYQHLIYVTVKGSGHMVPTDKPGQALQLIINFIQ
ncbi:Lysosomal protective protein [Halotydeus destructor]|nr:Lysosomal protective protein [Halotydeus destructor]